MNSCLQRSLETTTGAKDGDGFFCLNFRADRAREIMAAIGDPAFDGFDAGKRPQWAGLLGMAAYSDAQHCLYEHSLPQRGHRQYVGGLGRAAWQNAVPFG